MEGLLISVKMVTIYCNDLWFSKDLCENLNLRNYLNIEGSLHSNPESSPESSDEDNNPVLHHIVYLISFYCQKLWEEISYQAVIIAIGVCGSKTDTVEKVVVEWLLLGWLTLDRIIISTTEGWLFCGHVDAALVERSVYSSRMTDGLYSAEFTGSVREQSVPLHDVLKLLSTGFAFKWHFLQPLGQWIMLFVNPHSHQDRAKKKLSCIGVSSSTRLGSLSDTLADTRWWSVGGLISTFFSQPKGNGEFKDVLADPSPVHVKSPLKVLALLHRSCIMVPPYSGDLRALKIWIVNDNVVILNYGY